MKLAVRKDRSEVLTRCSFVFHRSCTLFERRASKIVTTVTSTFTAYYVHLWSRYFPNKPLTVPLPSFDGRAVCYPSESNLRDYMSWRQVDCHINNLYNTTFWTLVLKGGLSNKEAEAKLSGTLASDKNEILFSQFGINYNNEPDIYKKGSILYRDYALHHPRPQPAPPNPLSPPIPKTIPIRSSTAPPDPALRAPATVVHAPILLSRKENESGQVEKRSKTLEEKIRKRRGKADVIVYSGDMVKDEFWNMRPWILEGGVGAQKEVEVKPEN